MQQTTPAYLRAEEQYLKGNITFAELRAIEANARLVTCPCGGAHREENHGKAPRCVCPAERLAEAGHFVTCPVRLAGVA